MLLEKNYYTPGSMSLKNTFRYLDKDIEASLIFLDRKVTIAGKIFGLFSPNMMALVNYRFAHYFFYKKIGFIKLKFIAKILTFINLVLFGCEIYPYSEIGPGFFLGHTVGTAIVAKIGKNVSVFGKANIGGRGDGKWQKGWLGGPVIGDNVTIGIGSFILGPLEIGDNVFIKAMTLVADTVPSNSVAGGNPAKISPNKRLKRNK